MIRIFVVLHEGFDKTHLKFFEFFKPPPEMETIYVSVSGEDIGSYTVTLALRDLVKQSNISPGTDLVFIPGSVDSEKELSQEFLDDLTPIVVGLRLDIITVDSSILGSFCQDRLEIVSVPKLPAIIKIRTAAALQIPPHMRECAFARPKSSPEQSPIENIIWHRSPVVYDSTSNFVSTWSTSSGSPVNLKSLAVLLRDALRIDGVGHRAGIFPPLVPMTYEDGCNSIEVTSRKLREIDRLDDQAFGLIYGTAARLAVQGFLDAGTSIISALLVDFPTCLDGKNEGIRWRFEFLWEIGETRPASLPWETPSPEMLSTKQTEQMTESYPSSMDQKLLALEVIDTKISLGDLPDYPYSLRVAAAICVELGNMDRTRRYLDLEFKRIIQSTHLSQCVHLLGHRALGPILLEGAMGRMMGQTAEGAASDAEAVIAAIRSWSTDREPRRRAREDAARRFAALSTGAILDILEPSKADDEITLRKEAATEENITDVEASLGLSLPEDYREFLRVSNGLNFMPSLELPGLRPVGELIWENASDLGLDELEVTLGMRVDEEERELLPRMGRLLMISAADDEEQVWLLEPSQVENSLQILKTQRGLTRFSQPVGWRVVLWRHWCPETVWFRSFRSYLESAAKRAAQS